MAVPERASLTSTPTDRPSAGSASAWVIKAASPALVGAGPVRPTWVSGATDGATVGRATPGVPDAGWVEGMAIGLSRVRMPGTTSKTSPTAYARTRLRSTARAARTRRTNSPFATRLRAGQRTASLGHHDCREGTPSNGVRRHDRDPPGQPQQVRGRPRERADPPGPAALHLDPLPGRLRLRRGQPRRGRRPAGRARPARRADLARVPRPGPADRHVPHARRGGWRRQDPLRPRR